MRRRPSRRVPTIGARVQLIDDDGMLTRRGTVIAAGGLPGIPMWSVRWDHDGTVTDNLTMLDLYVLLPV